VKDLADTVRALTSIKNRQTNAAELEEALKALSALPVSEAPEFWVRIVNDPIYPEEQRRKALLSFFRRHIQAGAPVEIFHRIAGTEKWFDETTVIPATLYGTLPVKLAPGEGAFMFAFPLLRSPHAAIYLRTSKVMGLDYFLLVL